MPIRKVLFQAGSIYHVYNRGSRRSVVFTSAEEYKHFLCLLMKYAALTQHTILAYCLMPNHFHLLIRQNGEIPVSRLMKLAVGQYCMWFNARHGFSGRVFETRYKAVMVDRESYLAYIAAYIHLNPFHAHLADDPAQWPYSDCRNWVEGLNLTSNQQDFIDQIYGSCVDYSDFLLNFQQRAEGYSEDIRNFSIDAD